MSGEEYEFDPQVPRIAANNHWHHNIASALEDIARGLRDGSIKGDQGVLVLRNRAGEEMHPPVQLGIPTNPLDVMGMLAYASAHHFAREVRDL